MPLLYDKYHIKYCFIDFYTTFEYHKSYFSGVYQN